MYDAVWEFLIARVPAIRTSVSTIVTDFDPNLLTSTRRAFPTCLLRGCWNHYTRVSLSIVIFL